MNVQLVSMGVSTILAIGLLVTIVALNYFLGGFEFFFGKPRLTLLRTGMGKTGFAFGFEWNEDKEPASYDLLRVRLFNPFSTPSQLEVSKELNPKSKTFAEDLDMGPGFPKLISSIGNENASVMVEVTATREGISHQFDMKAADFLAKVNGAEQTADEFNEKKGYVKPKQYFHEAKRSFIAEPLQTGGKKLKIATNPEFAGEFAAAGGAGAGPAAENFNITKVWIEPGCIVCDACETIFPEVFEVTDSTCVIRPDAPLNDGLRVEEAADACPVEVIKFTKA